MNLTLLCGLQSRPRIVVSTVVVALLALTACKSGSSIDRTRAQKVSDSFMSDLVADRVNDAVVKMDPEIVQSLGQAQAEAAIRKLFDYCGRPLDSECFFAVEVVPADAGFKVTTFGPLRLQSGQLPEWLR